MEVEHMVLLVVNVASKAFTNNYLPRWKEFLIELCFQVLGKLMVLGF